MPKRNFRPIIQETHTPSRMPQGTMSQSKSDLVTVRFQCDGRSVSVTKSLYIVGNHASLGNWVPNKVSMYDDGTHGDEKAGDGIWTLSLELPAGADIQYKYTNSGAEGSWNPGEEFSEENRFFKVDAKPMVILDLFGKK